MIKNVLITALLASAFLPLGASAKPYSVKVSGKLDSQFTETYDSSFGLDLNHWLGNSYSLQMNFDNDPAKAVDSINNGSESVWSFPQNSSLALNGTLTLSPASDGIGANEIYMINDQYIPADFSGLPPGVTGDVSVDGLFLGAGHFVGYQGGSANLVQELVWFNAAAIWTNLATIQNLSLPDLLNTPLNFAGADYKWLAVDAIRWSSVDGQSSVGRLYGSVDSIQFAAVNNVPEPETYAMLLAGLGLLAWKLRRRG
ncbi:MAG: PEP-CTERM sorting domain-containing protein [Methylophilaceae bacterium]